MLKHFVNDALWPGKVMIRRRRFPRIFPGWWTVLAGSIINLWGLGYHLYGISALFKPIAADLGFSRAETSGVVAINRLLGGIEGPLSGGLTDRFGPKWVIVFGVFLLGLGLIVMNYVDSLWAFYVAWGVILGTGGNIALMLPLDKAIAEWFVKKRGLAQGIRWVFRGLSGVLVLPLIAWLIVTRGWRMACLIGGIVMLVVGLPLAFFSFKRYRPEYYGLLPDGARVGEEQATDTSRMIDRGIKYAAEVGEVEFTLRQAAKTPAFWLLIVASAIHGFSTTAIVTHSIPFFTDIGIDPLKAAGILALMALVSIPSRFAGGLVTDRLKKQQLRFIMGTTYLLEAGGMIVFLLNPNSIAMIYVWFILRGIGTGGGLVLTSLLRARYFGRKALGSIGGFSSMFLTPAGMIAPIYIGWVYDSTGSYISAFNLLAALIVAGGVITFFILPPKPPAQVTDIRQFV